MVEKPRFPRKGMVQNMRLHNLPMGMDWECAMDGGESAGKLLAVGRGATLQGTVNWCHPLANGKKAIACLPMLGP